MDGFLLKNSEGVLGLIILDEMRPIRRAVYSAAENRLSLWFLDGAREKLLTPIDAEFASHLRSTRDLFVAHFARNGLEGDPFKEYHVPLATAVAPAQGGKARIELKGSRPIERLTVRVRR